MRRLRHTRGAPRRSARRSGRHASTDEPRQRPPAGARRCHDALDAAGAAAYGWSADISDAAALRGWRALNSGARGSLGHCTGRGRTLLTSVSCSIRQVTRLRRAAERGQKDPRRRPRSVAGGAPLRRLVHQPLRPPHAAACRRDAVAAGRIRPARLRVWGRQQRHQWGGAGRCPAGDSGRSCHVEADGRCWCPTWRVPGWLEPSLVGVDRRVLRQLNPT